MSETAAPRSTSSSPVGSAVKLLSIFTGLLVALLAVGAFALSFDALQHLAEENGVTSELTWVWPLVLDGAIVVFSLSALRASLYRESIRYPMALVVIATAASVLFNVAHAPNGLLAHTMAAVPPVFLFLSFELLMRQLRSEVERSSKLSSLGELTSEMEKAETARLRLSSQIEKLTAQRDGLKTTIRSDSSASVQELLDKANLAKADKMKARRDKVSELAGQELPLKEIADALGVSTKTVKRDLAALDLAA
ncbi:DUF2637 domain-containing protein [Verrucomicrobiales bacterium BCK34]|nr:DUF2637 domain-containing protein [Verrucomicrobiales bacterium BCK34]